MKTEHIQNHNVSQMNSYLFDTNVWLFIFGPVAGAELNKQRAYSNLLRDITDRGAGLFITSLVLSEYINRVLRINFNQWKRANQLHNADYKRDYRHTAHFSQGLEDAKSQAIDILNHCTAKYPDNFNNIDIEAIVNSMSPSFDYNDLYLVRCCERSNLILVSDDSDIPFIPSSIKLITT